MLWHSWDLVNLVLFGLLRGEVRGICQLGASIDQEIQALFHRFRISIESRGWQSKRRPVSRPGFPH